MVLLKGHAPFRITSDPHVRQDGDKTAMRRAPKTDSLQFKLEDTPVFAGLLEHAHSARASFVEHAN